MDGQRNGVLFALNRSRVEALLLQDVTFIFLQSLLYLQRKLINSNSVNGEVVEEKRKVSKHCDTFRLGPCKDGFLTGALESAVDDATEFAASVVRGRAQLVIVRYM